MVMHLRQAVDQDPRCATAPSQLCAYATAPSRLCIPQPPHSRACHSPHSPLGPAPCTVGYHQVHNHDPSCITMPPVLWDITVSCHTHPASQATGATRQGPRVAMPQSQGLAW